MTVLVVDDQDPIRKAIRRVLTGMGFETVLESNDGSDALKIIAKSSIDLIVADIYMRKVTGFQLLRKIRSQSFGSDIPIIIVTGEGGKEDIVKAVDQGADDYILKPFQIADLEKKVTTVLTKYHSPPPLLKLLRQGDKLSIAEQYEDALKLFESACRLDPNSARAKLCKALVLEKLGQIDEALALLKKSAEEHSSYYKNFAAMGNMHLAAGRVGDAIASMKNELELNPKQPARQILVAELLQKEGNFDGSIFHFREALKESPKSKDALIGMGRALENCGNNDKAIYYYRRARRHHPTLTKSLELIVQIYKRTDNPRGAVGILIDEIRQNPTQVDAVIILAHLYVKLEELAKALKVIDDGLARDPQNVQLLLAKGKILLGSNDSATACQIYKKVIAIEPISKHYALYAAALTHNKQFDEALKSMFSALHGTADRQRTLIGLADILKKMGHTFQAVMILQLSKAAGGNVGDAVLNEDIRTLMTEINARRGLPQTKKTV